MTEFDLQKLIDAALKVRENSYAPYSGFRVGAALLTDNNEVYVGCNVENISYTPTVCAERAAIFAAVSNGCRDFKAIVVATGDTKPAPPCGVCRQVISEFTDGDFKIVLVNSRGLIIERTLDDLFPYRFTPTQAIGVDKDRMWELLEPVIFADDEMSPDEMAIVKRVMTNIEEFDKFLRHAEKDGHISKSERSIIDQFRDKIYTAAMNEALSDDTVTDDEEKLLHRLAEVLKLGDIDY